VASVTDTGHNSEVTIGQKVRMKPEREKENRDSTVDTSTKIAKKEKPIIDDIS
jgi:hypothetical protein